MNPTQHLRVLCNNKEGQGVAEVRMISTRGAAIRGIKAFLMTVLAALFTLPIPGVHFVAFPGLLIASPIVGTLVFLKTRGKIEGMSGSFQCPSCLAQNVMEYQEGKPPFFGSCIACRDPYQVFPA